MSAPLAKFKITKPKPINQQARRVLRPISVEERARRSQYRFQDIATCNLCGRTFPRNKLERHMRKKHPAKKPEAKPHFSACLSGVYAVVSKEMKKQLGR
jgi:hypothetical protein